MARVAQAPGVEVPKFYFPKSSSAAVAIESGLKP